MSVFDFVYNIYWVPLLAALVAIILILYFFRKPKEVSVDSLITDLPTPKGNLDPIVKAEYTEAITTKPVEMGEIVHSGNTSPLLPEETIDEEIAQDDSKELEAAYAEVEKADEPSSETFAQALIPNPPGATLGINKTKRRRIRNMHTRGESYADISRDFEVSVRTVKRIIEYVDKYETTG